jgi:antitoxin HicB
LRNAAISIERVFILPARGEIRYIRSMLKTFSYPLTVEAHPEDGGFLAFFPSLPGCQTWGESYEAAVRNAEEALTLFIETLAANGDPIPEPAFDGPATLGVMVRADIAA